MADTTELSIGKYM